MQGSALEVGGGPAKSGLWGSNAPDASEAGNWAVSAQCTQPLPNATLAKHETTKSSRCHMPCQHPSDHCTTALLLAGSSAFTGRM